MPLNKGKSNVFCVHTGRNRPEQTAQTRSLKNPLIFLKLKMAVCGFYMNSIPVEVILVNWKLGVRN